MKTLDAFEFDGSGVSAAQLRMLAESDYVTRAEPVLLVGEAGTGKLMWRRDCASSPAVSGGGVRFTRATGLINELAEATHANQLISGARWLRGNGSA
jgi:hypothetical protein